MAFLTRSSSSGSRSPWRGSGACPPRRRRANRSPRTSSEIVSCPRSPRSRGVAGKVVDVVVEVLTGDAERIAAASCTRCGSTRAAAAAVVREDGATCWRASLQSKSASARRLHYWKRGERIELSRVVLHDDMEP
ncbi:hypothetical protein NKG05_10710 [Oerskovia sp. M15]